MRGVEMRPSKAKYIKMLEEQKGSPVQQSHVFSAFSFSSSLYLGFLLLTFFSKNSSAGGHDNRQWNGRDAKVVAQTAHLWLLLAVVMLVDHASRPD